MKDQRKHERFELPLEVRVSWPGRPEKVAVTKDFSDGGAFLMVMFDSEPPVDTVMELQLTSQVMGSAAPVLRGRVVRTTSEGVAFQFIQTADSD